MRLCRASELCRTLLDEPFEPVCDLEQRARAGECCERKGGAADEREDDRLPTIDPLAVGTADAHRGEVGERHVADLALVAKAPIEAEAVGEQIETAGQRRGVVLDPDDRHGELRLHRDSVEPTRGGRIAGNYAEWS